MVDLDTLVTNLNGWSLQIAAAMNDCRAIVGYGLLGGNTHGFLLTPVPEPSTFVLVLFGAIGLGLYGWRHGMRRFAALPRAVVLLAMACPAAQIQSFDWRAYPGNASLPAGNYITPVRDQG